ncbi:hypothetical protein DL98DRAFT_528973 [Cadophora sp. DSE1049]|nr:hypothetical protein DL98DRAFT_528973 [Cadophora sp. DSE1049]
MVSSTFLKDGKIASDGDWPEILKKANLEDLKPQSTGGSADDITVTGDDIWELEFSSEANVTYFKTPLVAEKGSAWVGDELDCPYFLNICFVVGHLTDFEAAGVMLLASDQIKKSESGETEEAKETEEVGESKDKRPVSLLDDDVFSRPIPLRGDFEDGDASIWKTFEISDSNKQLNSFITVLDPVRNTTVKLLKPAEPGSSQNPSALWCMTTPEAYVTLVKLSFVLTIIDIPILAWVNDKLGLNIESLDIPDIFLSATKTILYSLEDQTPLNPKWTFSVQFSILNFNVTIDFSEVETTFYVMPTKSINKIVTDLGSALGRTDGLDAEQIPSDDPKDPFSQIANKFNLWYVHLDKDLELEDATEGEEPEPEPEPEEDADGVVDDGVIETEAVNAMEVPASAEGPKGKASAPLQWGIKLLVSWKAGENKDIPVLIGLGYESRTKMFHGELILAHNPVVMNPRLPDYDHRLALPYKTLESQGIKIDDLHPIPPSISLWALFFSDCGNPPKELYSIPFNISLAELSYQTIPGATPADKTSSITFAMTIQRDGDQEPLSGEEAPTGGLVWEEISVVASRMAGKDPKTNAALKMTSIQIASQVKLKPKTATEPPIKEAVLDVALSYDNLAGATDWTLEGSVQNLSVALLADCYFDESCKSGAIEVLGKLNLSSLKVLYVYSVGQASSLLITGILNLGGLELDLSYQYVSTKIKPTAKSAAQIRWGDKPPNAELKPVSVTSETNWSFEAYLRVTDQEATIASIADSIVPGRGQDLPEFVGGIKIAAKGDPLNAPIKLIYTGNNTEGSLLAVWVNLGPFNMTFIQYRSMATATKKATTKSILRVSADQIPLLDKIPLVNELPQPFENLVYLWVGDPAQTNPNLKGFTREMIEIEAGGKRPINKALAQAGIPPILLKKSKTQSTAANATSTSPALQAGHHFIVVTNGKVVLDHIFEPGEKDKQPPKAGAPTPPPPPPRPQNAPPATTVSEKPPTKGDTNTKAGPLSISALSLQYKNGSLFVNIDASLVLGPLSFSVIGFTIEIELSKVKLDSLADIIKEKLVRVSLHGLAAGVDKPPLTLKGVFIHDTAVTGTAGGSIESYRGGIAVGFKAWKILAVGEYAIVTMVKDGPQFKSVFVYGKLDGPLVTLQFATISGVRLGFGYNSLVRLPKAEQLYQFPFISDSVTGDDPLKILNALKDGPNPFVYSKEGGCWFLAGMTITCFDCITLTAVLMFEVETKSTHNGVIIALLANGVFQMPPLAPPEVSLFYIELLIKVELNFIEGYIAADAALAPASYFRRHVYVPQAKLTGSGSFYSWFPPNAHSGDWVVTIGGYHRAYKEPDHYPHNLSRLGLNFVVGNGIHVIGGAYVAVTPKCAMAGGALHISIDVGPVSAYADIALDVFVNFKPFYFIAEMRLSVGIECEVDLLFVSFHVSMSLGADLVLWGPDQFGGVAHVHFWFFGFSIDFGSGLKDVPGVSLLEFYEMVKTAGPDSEPPPGDKTSNANPCQALHKYSIEEGLFPNQPKSEDEKTFPNTGANTEWKVLAGPLQIRIDADFALKSASLVNTAKDLKDFNPITTTPPQELNDFYAFPMHLISPVDTSHMNITIYFLGGKEEDKELMTDFRAELVLKNAPRAVWGKYTSDKNPLSRISGQKPKALENGSNPTMELCQGVRILPPLPYLDQCPVLDFDATAAMMVFNDNEPFPTFDDEQSNFLAEPFEPDSSPVAQWADFEKLWKGENEPSISDASGEKVLKSEIRGDNAIGAGILGLVVNTLGWNERRAAEKEKGMVPDVVDSDGKVLRKEWELVSTPPQILAEELKYYYPYLPMTTGPIAAAA